jgi:periplasmic mercuric ion binding protein
MRTISLICALFLFSGVGAIAQKSSVKKETIKVWGNCGMCKTTIEKAAKKAGAVKASWSEESHILNVSYNPAKTSGKKIQQAVAQSGYDTQDFTADDKAYDGLHGCCKYDRKTATGHCCADEKCGKDESACKTKGCCKDKDCCKSSK